MTNISRQDFTTQLSNYNYLLLSILLSIPAILLRDYAIFIFPVLIAIILSYIYRERFVIALILITLFTLVGELNRSLRLVVHLVDFSLLGLLFLKRFGLNFQEYKRIPKSLLYFVLLYFSAMLLSSVMSSYPLAGIKIIAKQIAFFMVVYVFYSLIRDKKDVKNYLTAIIIVAFVLVSISIFYLFQESFSVLDLISKNRARVSALITNAETSSNFYIISFPLLIITLLLKKQKSIKVFSLFLIIYLSIGLSLAMPRSALIAIVLSSTIIFFLLRRQLFYLFISIIFTISLLFIFIQPLNQILSLFLRFGEGLTEREPLWNMSLNIIKDHPYFGIGPGGYEYEFYNYFPYMLNNWWGQLLIYYHQISEGVNFSHNFFLVFFTEMGILGLLTAVMLPIIYIRIGIKTLKKYRTESKEDYYLLVALFATGVSMIFRNFFNSIGLLYLGGITGDLPFWLIFSIIIYFYRLRSDNSSTI